MAKKNKRMIVPYGAGREIAIICGVSEQTVSTALNFKTNSLVALEIRRVAKEEFKGKTINK